MFTLNKTNLKSALVYGIVTVFVVFALSVMEKIIEHKSIFGVDWRGVIDFASLSVLSILVVIVSLVKNFLTTKAGNFFGVITVIPDKPKDLPDWIEKAN